MGKSRKTVAITIMDVVVLVLVVLLLNIVTPCAVASIEDKKPQQHPSSQPPNIILMLADNLGYKDVSWFANSHNQNNNAATTTTTPYIDEYLGRQGRSFTNWNSITHLCSASRAAILTGQYPVRNHIYPGVFHNDAALGMLPHETLTLANHLKAAALNYRTSIVGKWHLGHRKKYLPTTSFGFDEYLGIPYHMSGGSLDGHSCNSDIHHTQYLPLYHNTNIVQQPVNISTLAATYVRAAKEFIGEQQQHDTNNPFFLYLPFSHVHQLCASATVPEQLSCQWSGSNTTSFNAALAEMDWIAGQVIEHVDGNEALHNNTIIIFTSDNGPWLAEQSCSGLAGPFRGQWYEYSFVLFVCFSFALTPFLHSYSNQYSFL